jgi:predicted component of type VI protein secretion system
MIQKLPLLAAFLFSILAPTQAPAYDRGAKPTTKDKQETKSETSSDSKNPWIHIEVLEAGQKEATVKVNLPLQFARTALQLAPDDVLSEGRIKVENTEFTVGDLRKMWKDLRAAGDAEFVTVNEKDSTVKISRKGERIYVNVKETDSKEEVHIEVPVSLVDALLTGEGDTLNVEAAVAELQKMGPGEVVRVLDGEDSVRIWIE